MVWEEDFLYPLYLLLIGSGVLGLAVAMLTHFLEGRRNKQQNNLEDRRKAREIALVEQVKELKETVNILISQIQGLKSDVKQKK